MAWAFDLKLDDKPMVLAGPILRRVTQVSATVWLVLQKPAAVRLSIRDSAGEILFGSRHTCAIGQNLHMVAVTAGSLGEGRGPGTLLLPNVIYSYDVRIDFDPGVKLKPGEPASQNLAQATRGAELGYGVYQNTPTFCMPPYDPNKLRLLHGSCRHPNGVGGKDALAILDNLIEERADDPVRRPHQLFLTGDQIYADDVSASLLMLLSSAADQLLGWSEILPIPPSSTGKPRRGSQVPPYSRREIAGAAGLTSSERDNHLFTLGEYICMYLFVWSDVLWQAADLPDFGTLEAAFATNPSIPIELFGKLAKKLEENTGYVQIFRGTLGKVRKALANIPTYMILDDHEITDDFHLCRNFCEHVYGNEMGKLVMQNGLVAYALCQHWGNDPSAFEDNATTNPPGRRLLAMLNAGGAETYKIQSAEIGRLVGVHEVAKLRAPPAAAVGAERTGVFAVYHDADAFKFNYVVDFPSHQVIVTDSRTWRAFPRGGGEGGELLPKDQIRKQVADVPSAGNRPLFVVISTNAPPAPIIRFGQRHPTISAVKSAVFDHDFAADQADSWELPSPTLDRLLVALADRLPQAGGATPKLALRRSAILMSGDVHSSFATRLLVSGAARFEDATPQPVNMVIAQLVSSSLRNQSSDTRSQHEAGFGWVVGGAGAQGYAGWNLGNGVRKPVVARDIHDKDGRLATRSLTGPGTRGPYDLLDGERIILQPDYGYLLTYCPAIDERALPDLPGTHLPPPSVQRGSQQAYRELTTSYKDFHAKKKAREIVGINNISEITLAWDPDDDRKRVVYQRVFWLDENNAELLTYTTQPVSLNPEDTKYSMKAALATLGWTGPLAWAP